MSWGDAGGVTAEDVVEWLTGASHRIVVVVGMRLVVVERAFRVVADALPPGWLVRSKWMATDDRGRMVIGVRLGDAEAAGLSGLHARDGMLYAVAPDDESEVSAGAIAAMERSCVTDADGIVELLI